MIKCLHTNIDTCKLRQAAHDVIDNFSDLLASKHMEIPSDDREGADNEDEIYGTEYYELEDAVTETLAKHFPGQ